MERYITMAEKLWTANQRISHHIGWDWTDGLNKEQWVQKKALSLKRTWELVGRDRPTAIM